MVAVMNATRRRPAACRLRVFTIAAIFVTTAAGCFSLSVLRHKHDASIRLVDMIPSDLDVLENAQIIGGLGVQLLLLGGFLKENGGDWVRDDSARSLTIEDRLMRITPTWKPSGQLDYSHDNPNPSAISVFGDALDAGTSVAQLADRLEGIGLGVQDFDSSSRAAISKMLTWRLPSDKVLQDDEDVTLLAFSFDATPLCLTVDDCPYPGPTNELLAATAAQFFATHKVRNILAQWEVASAILHSHTDAVPPETVVAIGDPGKYENTVQILEKMTCQLNTDTPSTVVLLAHPDHLRRVYHTTQTQWKHSMLRNNKCMPPPSYELFTAMQPYDLDWPSSRQQTGINLFSDTTALVHTEQQEKLASWYDENLGYFPDGDPQKWVHRRDVWILYENWAMMKGIVSGII